MSSGGCLNVLIVYGTTEGQARKIAEWTATHIRERGHQAEQRDSAALESDLDLETSFSGGGSKGRRAMLCRPSGVPLI